MIRAYNVPVGGTSDPVQNNILLNNATSFRKVRITLLATNGGSANVFISDQQSNSGSNGVLLRLNQPEEFSLDPGDRLWAHVNDPDHVYLIGIVDASDSTAELLTQVLQELKKKR